MGSRYSHQYMTDVHPEYQTESEKGQPNGYASLDGDGSLPTAQLPAYIEIAEIAEPGNPSTDKVRIYIVDQNGYSVIEAKGATGLTRRLARDNYFVAKVAEAAGVAIGDAVYISGATGANEQVKKAKADALATMPSIGLCLDAGALNAFVRVMFTGKIADLNTSAFTEGALVYISAATAGALTSTEPAFPNLSQRLGVVTKSNPSTGEILVLPTRLIEQTAHANLSGIGVDDHHARFHASNHGLGASDAVKLDDLGTPDDNTDLNASTLRHGLLLKLSGVTTEFLRGDGAWAVPPGGAAGDLDFPEIGNLTVATAKYHITARRHACTGSQRITVQGTGRMRVLN